MDWKLRGEGNPPILGMPERRRSQPASKREPQDIIRMALQSTENYIGDKNERVSTPISASASHMPANRAPVNVNDVQSLAQQMAVAEKGWGGEQWDALYELVDHESGWNPYANNPNSSAQDLFQFLDQTRETYGLQPGAPVDQQIRAGLQYIEDRYGDPVRALNHWRSRVPIDGRDVGNWY